MSTPRCLLSLSISLSAVLGLPSRDATAQVRYESISLPESEVASPYVDLSVASPRSLESGWGQNRPEWNRQWWTWQILPDGLMFRSYLAGGREPRFGSQWVHQQGTEWVWDVALGGRVAMLRYGTQDIAWPEGWQIDIEGAAFPRLTLDDQRDLIAADFRFGVPLTFRQGPWEGKFGYYHLSSHLGDEYKLTHPWINRVNYARDVLVLAGAVYPHPDWRFYAEAGWAFYYAGGSRPWEFQFGIDHAPSGATDWRGAPFFAINGRLRQEVDFGGNLTVQTGWAWRGQTGRLFRLGFHYFNGKSDLYQFFREHEELIGLGIWYDY